MDLFAPKHFLLLILLVIGFFVVVFPYWKIFSRAGFSGWLALGMVVPLVNLALVYFLAFADWPRDRTKP